MVTGAVLGLLGCGGGSSVSETSVTEPVVTEGTETSGLSEELINTLSYMGNEERLAYDIYNAFYKEYNTTVFNNIATNGEYQHITLVQELIQKYKLDDNVDFTNVDLDPLGYINTAIEDMQAGTYDISDIQELYDSLIEQGSSEIEALKVGCIVEVVDINDLDRDIILAESENATDIVAVFNTLRNGSYNHYWSFDAALKQRKELDGCCPMALSLGHIDCPTIEDYPPTNNQ